MSSSKRNGVGERAIQSVQGMIRTYVTREMWKYRLLFPTTRLSEVHRTGCSSVEGITCAPSGRGSPGTQGSCCRDSRSAKTERGHMRTDGCGRNPENNPPDEIKVRKFRFCTLLKIVQLARIRISGPQELIQNYFLGTLRVHGKVLWMRVVLRRTARPAHIGNCRKRIETELRGTVKPEAAERGTKEVGTAGAI